LALPRIAWPWPRRIRHGAGNLVKKFQLMEFRRIDEVAKESRRARKQKPRRTRRSWSGMNRFTILRQRSTRLMRVPFQHPVEK